MRDSSLRLLTNENIPASVVERLRSLGHDVLSAKESLSGKADEVILARAHREARAIVTQDKDFGELAFRHGTISRFGVILFRLQVQDPDRDIDRMVAVIESRTDWNGCFAVATNERLRIRPLPGSADV